MSHAESLRFPLPELPQLDPEDVKAVRSFLPGKLLGRTAAVLPTASRPRLRRRDSCVAEKGRDRPSQRLRKCELLVPGLFAAYSQSGAARRGHQTARTGRDVAGIGEELRPQHFHHAPDNEGSLTRNSVANQRIGLAKLFEGRKPPVPLVDPTAFQKGADRNARETGTATLRLRASLEPHVNFLSYHI